MLTDKLFLTNYIKISYYLLDYMNGEAAAQFTVYSQLFSNVGKEKKWQSLK